jgi:hypothetical protein
MNPRPAPPVRNGSKHPMRAAGEFFAWLWGPSEAERRRLSGPVAGQVPAAGMPVGQVRSQTVERVVDGGRMVLRRTVVEEIEIRPQ